MTTKWNHFSDPTDDNNKGAWVSKIQDPHQWIQAEFSKPLTLLGIQTQGRDDKEQYTTLFTVLYGDSTSSLKTYGDHKGNEKVGLVCLEVLVEYHFWGKSMKETKEKIPLKHWKNFQFNSIESIMNSVQSWNWKILWPIMSLITWGYLLFLIYCSGSVKYVYMKFLYMFKT